MNLGKQDETKPTVRITFPYNPIESPELGIVMYETFDEVMDYLEENDEMREIIEKQLGNSVPSLMEKGLFKEGNIHNVTGFVGAPEYSKGALFFFGSNKRFFITDFRDLTACCIFLLDFVQANADNLKEEMILGIASSIHMFIGQSPNVKETLKSFSLDFLAKFLASGELVKQAITEKLNEKLSKAVQQDS